MRRQRALERISEALTPQGWVAWGARALLLCDLSLIALIGVRAGTHVTETPGAEILVFAVALIVPLGLLLWALGRTSDLLRTMTEDAMTDALTGLMNRRGFRKALDGAEQGAILVIDIDHFKQVNDRYGHAAGDEVLKAMSGHLRRNIRETDLLARLGGEEFALYLFDCDSFEVDQIGERLCRGFVTFNKRMKVPIKVTMSIGAAYSTMAEDVDRLIQNADEALYQAKRSGRARLTFWQPPLASRL